MEYDLLPAGTHLPVRPGGQTPSPPPLTAGPPVASPARIYADRCLPMLVRPESASFYSISNCWTRAMRR